MFDTDARRQHHIYALYYAHALKRDRVAGDTLMCASFFELKHGLHLCQVLVFEVSALIGWAEFQGQRKPKKKRAFTKTRDDCRCRFVTSRGSEMRERVSWQVVYR